MRDQSGHHKSHGNRKTVMVLCVAIFAMLGLGFATKPLYDTFCRVTGYGGTTQVAEEISDTQIDRVMKVRFDTNVDSNLAWSFKPDQPSLDIKLGQNALAYFTATNNSDKAIIGTASYNVSPTKVAPYFAKLECFCFTEQKLEPGETVHMPVLFFVDAEMNEEHRLDEVRSVTLSYTFHKAKKPSDEPNTAKERQEQLDKLESVDVDVSTEDLETAHPTSTHNLTNTNNTTKTKGRG